jgi:hypothetical protein
VLTVNVSEVAPAAGSAILAVTSSAAYTVALREDRAMRGSRPPPKTPHRAGRALGYRSSTAIRTGAENVCPLDEPSFEVRWPQPPG